MNDPMNTAWWSLRIAFFLGPFLAGLDKFFYRLTNWDQYLRSCGAACAGQP